MAAPTPQEFATWPRAKQIEYLNSTYGNIEDRARAAGVNGVAGSARFRSKNIANIASPEEQALWGVVNRDGGTWAGQALGSVAPYALAAGLAAAGYSALPPGAGAGVGAGSGSGGSSLGVFANGGAGGLAGVGGGNAGALAASGGIAGGAGAGTSLGGLLGGGGAAAGGGTGMGWLNTLIDVSPDILGSVLGHDAAGDAADLQRQGSKEAIAESRRQYDQSRADLAPYRDAGAAALSDIGRGFGREGAGTTALGDFNRDFTAADFQKDPGYQFRMDEGTKALEGSAAASGGLFSGATGKRLERYGQDYASGEYSNAYNRFNQDRTTRFNRLASIAGVGQTATNTGINAGQNASNNITDSIIGGANAAAAGRVGEANALTGGLETLGNYYRNRRYGGNPSSSGWIS